MLPIGDARRPLIGQAIFATLLAAAVFSIFTGPVKQIKPLYNHAPWLNDPYDAIVSFAMFFVPFIALCCLAPVSLCRQSEALPILRVGDLLRGCRVLLVAISATLLSEWIAVVVGANRTLWNRDTSLQVGLVLVTTAFAGRAGVKLRRASTGPLYGDAHNGPTFDWLTDIVAVAQVQSHWLGPLSRSLLRMLSWATKRPIRTVRRHPLWAAALACGAFGLAVMVSQGVREGYDLSSTFFAVVLLGCGMFGLLVVSGSYVGLVRSETTLVGPLRRLVDAAVITCIGILVPFAFRYHLWWVIGSNNNSAGIPQLVALLAIFAILIFSVTFAVESHLRLHSEAP